MENSQYGDSLYHVMLCFRPTAVELMKHAFFKKAKEKKWLQQTLVAGGPTLKERALKAKTVRRIGTSGRLHRNTETGDWEWSDDDDDDEKEEVREGTNTKQEIPHPLC